MNTNKYQLIGNGNIDKFRENGGKRNKKTVTEDKNQHVMNDSRTNVRYTEVINGSTVTRTLKKK